MAKYDWEIIKEVSVNSKVLNTTVREYIEEGLEHANVVWSNQTHRDSFVAVIEDMMQMLAEDDKVIQWNIMCDGRNNKTKDMNAGRFYLDVHYKQRNCINFTRLTYQIDAKA